MGKHAMPVFLQSKRVEAPFRKNRQRKMRSCVLRKVKLLEEQGQCKIPQDTFQQCVHLIHGPRRPLPTQSTHGHYLGAQNVLGPSPNLGLWDSKISKQSGHAAGKASDPPERTVDAHGRSHATHCSCPIDELTPSTSLVCS